MPTVCKLTLDAEEYRQELASVVAESRSQGAELEEVFSGSTGGDVAINVDTNAAETAAEVKDVLDDLPDEKHIEIHADKDSVSELADASSDAIDQAEELANAAGESAGKTGGLFSGLRNLTNGLGEQIGKGATAVGALGAVAGASVPPVGALAAVVNALLSPIALITAALSALVMIGMEVWDNLTVSAEEYAEETKQASEAAQRQLDKTKELSDAAGKYISRLKELSSAEAADNRHKAESATLIAALESKYGSLGAVIDKTTGKITNLAEVERRLNAARNAKLAQKYFASSHAAMDEAKAAYMKVRGNEWFTTESGAGKIWDARARSTDMQGLLREMETAAKNAKTLDDKKGYAEVAAKIRAAIEARNKGRTLKSTGYESENEAIQALASSQAAAAASTGALADARRAYRHRQSDDEFADALDDSAKRANRNARLQEEQSQYKLLADAVANARQQLERIQKQKDADGNVENTRAEADAVKQLAEAELAVQRNLDRQYSLKRQLADLDKQRAQNAQKLRDSLHSRAQDLYYQALSQSGREDQARAERAIAEAEQTKGEKLTDAERSHIETLTALAGKLEKLSQSDIRGDLSIKTNSLAARGGFASSVLVPDADKYNQRLLDKTIQLLDTTKAIERLFREGINF